MEDVNKFRMVWMESPEMRLHDWREFRNSLVNCNLDDLCNHTQQWWSFAPLSNLSIDPYNIETWEGAWEMVYHGDICKFSIALGMAYTIYYHDSELSNKIMRVQDTLNNDIYMICMINDTWVLNYNTCELARWEEIQHTIVVQEQWECVDVINAVH